MESAFLAAATKKLKLRILPVNEIKPDDVYLKLLPLKLAFECYVEDKELVAQFQKDA